MIIIIIIIIMTIIITIMHNDHKGDDYYKVRQNIVILLSNIYTKSNLLSFETF